MNALADIGAERTILGCGLSDESALHKILPILAPDDFSLQAHRVVFRTMSDLANAGKPVDDLTVCTALGEKSQLDSIGGESFVWNLSQNVTDGIARVTNVEHYAAILRDKSRRRQAHAAAHCLIKQAEDVSVTTDEALQQVQEDLLRIEAASGKSTGQSVKTLMPDVLKELEQQATSQNGLVGLPTGLGSLDLLTGGIRQGELWTIGALPGRGKTALAIQILLANGKAGIPCSAFSLEMQSVEIGKRFIVAQGIVPATQLRNPQVIRRDRWPAIMEAAAEVSQLPIFIDDRSTIKIQELLASARLYIRRHGVKLIVVDYLRLVDAPGRDVREKVSTVADSLRQLAKRERVGVVLLSQLRRPDGGINARPSMLDLKESGDVEAHSHVVLLPYLPIAEDGNPLPEEQLLMVGKNRNGGIGSLPVYFDEKRLQFLDRTGAAR